MFGPIPVPLFFFAGIWRPWTGTRGTKANPVEGEHLLYSFLTTEANEIVKPIHAKAMPVMLGDCGRSRLKADGAVEEALELQRSLPTDIASTRRRELNAAFFGRRRYRKTGNDEGDVLSY